MYTYEDSVKLSLAEQASKAASFFVAPEWLLKTQNKRIVTGLANLKVAMRLQKVKESFAIHAAMADAAKEVAAYNPYCPTCQSCGETGCCPPTGCKTVICHYGESNLRDYKTMETQLETLYNELAKFLGEPCVNRILSDIENKYLQGK